MADDGSVRADAEAGDGPTAADGEPGGESATPDTEPGDESATLDAEAGDEHAAPDAEPGGADGEAVIRARNLVKEYDSGEGVLRALKGIDLAVHAGEFVAIVGPSGSGKSTLLNQLGLLDTPTEGTVTVEGTSISDLSIAERTRLRKRTVGFVFQNFYLIPTLSAVENVKVPRLLEGDRKATDRRATELLERVGLGDRLDHLPNQLSGGQKQRVAVARSLINEPDLLLADEPTGNLDRDTGSQVLAEFGRITDEGVAVVAVTHDEQVTEFADRTVELVDGELT
ncbi:ABC transporter ATP-binding protein [Halorussus sp. JP-T4]|nr:ABC transporter ATP-binding protein [Halorussus sp. JP-T4]